MMARRHSELASAILEFLVSGPTDVDLRDYH